MSEQKEWTSPYAGHPMEQFHTRRAFELYKEFNEHQKALAPVYEYHRERKETVHNIYEVGELTIVEVSGFGGDKTHEFTFWMNGQHQHEYATGLDQCLLLALCTKYGSESAAYWVARMIGMVKPKEA